MAISYSGPPSATGGVIQVIVGQKLSPTFQVTLSGVPQPTARYVLSLADPEDADVLRIYGSQSDSVEVVGRGSATLVATLVVATVGVDTTHRASVTVVATPASNIVDSTSLTFGALNATKQLTGSSLKEDGSPIPLESTSLTWSSANPAVATVTKLTDNTASVTAVGNGVTTVTATFDGVDLVIVPITVSQRFARFRLSSPAVVAGEIAFASLGVTATATATPLDSLGSALVGGSQPPPTPAFASTLPALVSVDPTSGLVTALENTDPATLARVYAAVSNVSRSDSIRVSVKQKATTITHSGPRTDTISSIGGTKQMTAVATDANGRPLAPSSITWASLDPSIASVNISSLPVTVTGVSVGTTRIAASRPVDLVGDTITIVVINAAASVAIAPATTQTLTAIGATRAFTATVTNGLGETIPGAAVTWSVPVGATFVLVNASGVASALANGTATVRATSGSASADVTVIVGQELSASQSTITAVPTSIAANGTSQSVITVQLKDANGHNLANGGGASVQITSSLGTPATQAGSDQGNGRYTATLTSGNAAGTATVAATVGGIPLSATTQVAFTAGSAVRYVVTPNTTAINLGGSVLVSAQLVDAGGNPVAESGHTVGWTATGPGGHFATPTSLTDANGVAQIAYTPTVAGTHAVTALDNVALTGLSADITVSNLAPSLTNVNPASGNRLAQIGVTLTGSNFVATTTVDFGAGITLSNVVVANSTTITATVTIAETAATGLRGVTVTSPAPGGGSATLANAFGVNNPPPTLTSLAPASGNRLQTVNVVFTGSGFIAGVSSVNVGDDITVNSTTVNSSTQITANITIGGTAATGPRSFSVTNTAPGGGPSATQSFTVNNPSVTLASVAPAGGNRLQTLNVVFTGSGFLAGVSAVDVGTGITVNSTTVNSPTQITANLTITAAAVAGARDFTVTNTPGGTSSPQTFTVNNPPPTLTSIAATSGDRLQTLNVVFTGTGFIDGVSSVDVGTGITVNSTTVNSPTQITANITITGAAALGVRSFTVVNAAPGGGTSAAQNFSVVNNPPATLASIAPTSGSRLQTLDVVLTGTGFITGVSTVTVSGAGVTINSTTVDSPTQITANISIAATAATGNRNVRVNNAAPGGGLSVVRVFTIDNPAPTLTAVAPASADRFQTLDVVLTGTGFIAGVSTPSVGGTGVVINNFTVNSGTQITANVTITDAAATGARDFSVTNTVPGGGTSATQTFTVNNPPATLTAIAPASGERLQTLDVVLTGTGFIAGVSSVNAGTGIAVNTTTVNSATQITANITIAATAATGARDFSVTNAGPGGGTSAAQTFTVNNPAPTLTALAPTSANRLQTLDVVFTGTGFVAGASTVDLGADITVHSVTVDSPTQLTANFTINSGAVLGDRSFTVTNTAPGGGTSATQTFTINNPSQTLTGIAPTSGNRLQTLDVVFTGTGFLAGVSSVDVGPGITVNTTTVNNATQITANLTITTAAATGPRGFSVTNTPGGTSASHTFTVNNPPPTLTGIAPTSGDRLQNLNVIFTGSGFIDGVTTVDAGAGITVNSIVVNSSTTLTANLTISGAAAIGARNITVSNAAPGGGTSGAQIFSVANNPLPTLNGIAPTSADRLQTLDVVLTGSGFIDGVTTVNVGTGITVNTTTVNSPNQITANITVTGAAGLGARNFTVTNAGPGGGSSGAQAFTVVNNPPATLTAIAPASGERLQTLDVVLTGTGFIQGVSSVSISGTGVALNSTTVNSTTQITANVSISANAATGARNVTVTNPAPGGGSSATQTFTVDNPAATLTTIAPSTADRLQTLDVVFTGTGFIAGVSTVNVGAGITVNSTTIDSPTQITANVTITAAAATGPRDFSVTNTAPGGGTSATQSFTVSNPAATLTALAPTTGDRLQTLDVVFTGSGFITGVSTVSVGPDITVNSTTVNSPAQLTANITIAETATFGARDFTVTNAGPGGGTSAAQSFTVANNPAPNLTAIAPTSADRPGTLDVVFTGSGFITGASSVNVGPDIAVNSVTVNSATQITANLTISASAATGARDFTVTTAAPGGGTSAAQSFTVTNPAPTLTAVVPATGERLQTLDVVFTGSGFATGVSTVNVGTGITVNTTTVDSPTQITANITVTAAATTGARDFSVTNAGPGGGTTAAQTFTVSNPGATLASIAPTTGDRLQTLDVVFTGSGFIAGVSTVSVGPDITVNTTTVDNTTQITANITITGAAALGDRSFTVTNAGPGGGTSAAQTFTVANNPGATLTSIAPVAGDRLQTLDVVFTGTGFITGVSSVNVGPDITVNTTTVNSPSQITANITVSATAATGARDFSVTNAGPGGGTSAAQSFTVNNPGATLASIAPTSGERLQTLDVVFTGTGFITGVSSVNVGPDITVNTTTVNSSTQLTASITIIAAAATGARSFSVTNAGPGGGTSATQAFTVNTPVPNLASIAPTTGDRLQTLDVVFTGSGFIAGTSTVNVGPDITVNSETVDSPTQITANLTITGAAALGDRSFAVTNAGGGTSGAQTFTVANNPGATLTSIAPVAGDRLQTLDVVFTGTGFITGVSSVNVGPDITVNTTTVDSPTQLTANITISATAATGARDFSVTNAGPGGGTSATQSFTVNNPGATLTAIAPITGDRLQTLDVVLTGTGFITGVSSVNVGPDITVNTTTVDSPTQITTNITVSATAATGARDFSVTNAGPGGGTSATQTFTVNNPEPGATLVTPALAVQGETDVAVTVTGSNFISGATTADFGADVSVSNVVVVNATTITATLAIGAGAALGARDVTVTTAGPGGGTATITGGLTINAPAAPSISPPLAPDAGSQGATLTVVIDGTGFYSGVTTVDFGPDIAVNSVTVLSPTQVSVSISIGAAAALGQRDVTVTNNPSGGSATATLAFTVNP